MIYLVQILSVLFAYACARHDAPAVDSFSRYHYFDSPDERIIQTKFHSFNWVMKFAYCLACSIPFGWPGGALAFLMCGEIIWLVFDPVLNVYRIEKKAWYYLSESNKTDTVLLRTFGKRAGAWKAGVTILFIVLLNLLYLWIV